MVSRRWGMPLEDDVARRVRADAVEVARRVVDPELKRRAIALSKEQTAFPTAVQWRPHVIAQGDAGLALLCAYVDTCFPGDGWDVAGHGLLAEAASALEAEPSPRVGLFDGLAGLAFATFALSAGGTRYRRLLGTVDGALVPRTMALAGSVAAQARGISVAQYDVISGLAGVAAYLLLRAGEPATDPALVAGLRALVALAEPGHDPPRWHSPPSLLDERMRESFPDGNLNCGLAHGIPGPLAVLALAHRQGVVVDGMATAIEHMADWLVGRVIDGPYGPTWPVAVPMADGRGPPPAGCRTAWCYGAPGVARALWLAGDALDRCDWRAAAMAAMEAVYRTPLAGRGIDSPTFCHGGAGLLQISMRFAHDTGAAVFDEAVVDLVAQLGEQFDPASLLGFRSVERADSIVDQPGLLDGAPGVALALLAAGSSHVPAWDRLFLLA